MARQLHLSLYLYSLLSLIKLQAQNTPTDAHIVGDVQCNGIHVPFVNITIDGTTIGTMTDASGHFQIINLPEGNYTVRVSGLGYKATSKAVSIVKNKTIEIKFDIEEDLLQMDEIIVSADRNQTNRKEAPVVVTSISPKIFEATQSLNLADGLCFAPGLRTESNCQNCGFTQIRMNGLEGPYTQILMNSRPVFNGLAGVYALELIPSNMIQRLEVVRGGGSTLFGGNAIAGTINIITKEKLQNSFEINNRFESLGVGVQDSGTPAFDHQLTVNGSIVSDDKKTGGYIYALLRNREAFDANNDGFTEIVEMENTTFGFNVFHKPSIKSKLALDGYRIDEYRRGGNKLETIAHRADITEQLEHLITGGNLSYELYTNSKEDKLTLYASAQQVKRDSYYGAEQDLNAYGYTTDLSSSLGSQYVINSKQFIFPTSTTIFGIDNTNNKVHDTKLGGPGVENTTLSNQFVNTSGAFVQQDWKSKTFNLSAGVRYDYYLVNDLNSPEENINSNAVFIPRINFMYKITPEVRLRAGYAKGYRAPQIYNEDLHVELVNASRVRTVNDTNLQQEISHAFTASLNTDFYIKKTPCYFLIEGFHTQLNNPFSDEFFDPNNDGNFVYLRVNAQEGASVTGANIEFKSFITTKLETQIGLTIQESLFDAPQAWGEADTSVLSEFTRTPNQYGYANLNYTLNKHFNANLSLNYTGAMWIPHFGLAQAEYDTALLNGTINAGDVIIGERLERSPDFLTVDLQFSYRLNMSKNNQSELELYAGVKNMFNAFQDNFDSGLFRDSGYVYGPRQPRSINLGIIISKL